MYVCVDQILTITQIKEECLISHFDVEDTEARYRENWMVSLVKSINEIVATLKGSKFGFDLDFEPSVDPFPFNLP